MSPPRADVDLASVAAAIGEPSRAAMLDALMTGTALTAGELARVAGIGPSTASAHLARLIDVGLVEVAEQGRHRYHRLSGPDVAQALESLSHIAPAKPVRTLRESSRARSLWFARTCYDHLAGACGVALHDLLLERELIVGAAGGYDVSAAGEAWFAELGVDVSAERARRRSFARPCLDWTERRPHLAGALAAVTVDRLLALGWFVRRGSDTRALRLTEEGSAALGGLWGEESLGQRG
ncbi:DNA-binding transcriptional ArsR family regulator [Nocardioides albertanoniae]|uniref:DNA-binding transcriptional ArsR family regulator n=1 Tax=Nocardioides albertanoniae TaxID=1175486 RepID=A0A543A350_9ACTN|nr:winged helix-turn-helix domain-containing protein [Nocardioides albertanoniae]TQL67011.1 DNA-binding transcriptional ArsR family regulator [Nocardioides albertanoniae]